MKSPPAVHSRLSVCLLMACLLGLVQSASQASTLLFSHTGATNPTTQGWTITSGASEVGAVEDDLETGIDAWRVYEQGGTNSRTYNQSLTSTQLSDALLTGWTMDATIRYVPPDPLVAATPTNNAWCTMLIDEGVAGKRMLYGLAFGNDAAGNTIVSLYNAAASFTVTPGYHDYQLIWDPVTEMASFFIDGELKKSDYQGTGITNSGSSRVYWGDNSGTETAVARGGHYAYVGLSIGPAAIPEPNRMCFMMLAAGMVVWRRRR